MNKILKKNLCVVLTLVLMFSFNLVAFAKGATSIALSESTIGVGDSTTVSITASSSGTVTVKYTASLLTLSDCTATGYKSEGNTVTFSGTAGDLVFTAAGEGTASIIVSSSTCSGSSTVVTISGAGTGASSDSSATTSVEESPAEENSESSETEEQPSVTTAGVGTLNADGGFDIDGVSYVVSERYSDKEIPSGFSKVSLKIGNGTYNELSNGTVTIIYLKPADKIDGSGVFYLYDAESSTVAQFKKLGASNNYVIIGSADSVPSALFAGTLTTESGEMEAYLASEGSEFYYVYGTSNAGVVGWFVYDASQGTISRADEALLNAAVSSEEATSEATEISTYDPTEVYKVKLAKLRKIISALVVLCVLLVFYIVNVIVRKKMNAEENEEEGEDDEKSSDDIFARAPVKTARKMPRSIVFKDEDEDDEEDDEDDTPHKGNGTGSGSSKNSGLNMMDLNDL